MEELKSLAELGGLAIVALYSIGCMNKVMTNHLEHNTKAIEHNSEILEKLSDTITDLKNFLQRK